VRDARQHAQALRAVLIVSERHVGELAGELRCEVGDDSRSVVAHAASMISLPGGARGRRGFSPADALDPTRPQSDLGGPA
jgi:hypothetical protein